MSTALPRAGALGVLALTALLGLAQGACTTTCDIVGSWQHTTSASCGTCGTTSCSAQGADAITAALNVSICTSTMRGCYDDCRRNNPNNPTAGPGGLDCRCATQCYSGECRDRFERYFSCLITNCTTQCR